MNKPKSSYEPKVIINDLNHSQTGRQELYGRPRKFSEEVTIINRPIPNLAKPKNNHFGTIIGATVSAIAVVTGVILYNTKTKSSENQLSPTAPVSAATSNAPSTTNSAEASPTSEIPEPAPTVAINPIPAPSANPFEEKPVNLAPTNKPTPKQLPINQKPLPSKSEIIRETPF